MLTRGPAVLDGAEPRLTRFELALANRAADEGRALVVVANKADLASARLACRADGRLTHFQCDKDGRSHPHAPPPESANEGGRPRCHPVANFPTGIGTADDASKRA